MGSRVFFTVECSMCGTIGHPEYAGAGSNEDVRSTAYQAIGRRVVSEGLKTKAWEHNEARHGGRVMAQIMRWEAELAEVER